MEFNIFNEDVKYYLLSKCSFISILKLYNANNSFISKELLNNLINNKWAINIGKEIWRSILDHEYLNFDKKLSINTLKTISNCNIWATNSIVNLKYNNIDDKDVAVNDLLICYDKIFINNNPPLPKKYTDDIGIFKRLIGDGDAFDLNILEYVNIYNIYEIFKASITFGKMSVFKEKLKDNIISNFDRSPLSSSLLISLRSKIPSYILEKIDNKRVSLLNLNKKEYGLKYMHLLNNIFDNCVDDKYYKFKVYIAIQICKFISVFKENLGKDHTAIIAAIDKMRAFNNLLGFKIINVPEYLHFYATFEISYILSKLAY
jgi:hypothetical protein